MYVVKCSICNQQIIMEIKGSLTDEVCPSCNHPGDKLEIVSSVEDLMPDPDLIARAMSSI